MRNVKSNRFSRNPMNYTRSYPNNQNQSTFRSNRTIVEIEMEKREREKATKKPSLGPRMTIKHYMIKYGDVPDDDILTYMKKQMPTLGEGYIKGLINKVRNEIRKEIEAGEKGDDR